MCWGICYDEPWPKWLRVESGAQDASEIEGVGASEMIDGGGGGLGVGV